MWKTECVECVWLVKRDDGEMSMMRVVSDMRAKSVLDYYTNWMCYSTGKERDAYEEIVVDAWLLVGWVQ